jgi:hypothetical protein
MKAKPQRKDFDKMVQEAEIIMQELKIVEERLIRFHLGQ